KYPASGLDRAMREVFFTSGSFETSVLAWLDRKDTGLAEFIGRARSALALATLRSATFRPDLVVLDEFHRYADLILPAESRSAKPADQERAAIHALLAEALLGGKTPPAVLLLSATPYRLRRLSGEDIHPVEHYRALIDLAGFLTGSESGREKVEAAMRAYQEALRAPGDAAAVAVAVGEAKAGLETLLRPIVARTERALVHEADLFERPRIPVEPDARDLELFRHFAMAVQGAEPQLRAWAPAMWSSIPYPAQTLHNYALWPSVTAAPRPPVEAGDRGPFAHPQLRALAALAGDPRQLSLPWQPPTIPWWRLEGPWSMSKPQAGKTLLFSRWKGAPTAVSALLSLQIAGPPRKPGAKAPAGFLRPGGGDASALIGLFAPWPSLSTAVNPIPAGSVSIAAVKKKARVDLADVLGKAGVALDGKQKRPVWEVALGLEHHLSPAAFRRLTGAVAAARTGTGTQPWDRAAKISQISPAELSALANHLLSAPGAVTARCAARHGVTLETAKAAKAVFGFTWHALRGYLGHRPFAAAILPGSGAKRYPDALCAAVLKGGFEAVLDEQMTVLSALGDAKGLKIIDGLAAGLIRRPGLVRLRRGRRDTKVAVQAVMPFSGGEQQPSAGRKGGKLRSDSLRKAFNSPFWPHILCTTSVGQEGLDFHLWCGRLVHWDLPADPVDFEQREGRIARYASLAVRRSLAAHHGAEALAGAGEASPSLRLLEIARQQPPTDTGLERWWLPSGGRPESISFDWKFSLRSARKARMLEDLLYYRLALGQPDTAAFVAMLERIGADEAQARSLAINLAPISAVVQAAR
ncbi:MAG: helicase C-terminal domain-containing protein, partial [Brevundimonas sp.]